MPSPRKKKDRKPKTAKQIDRNERAQRIRAERLEQKQFSRLVVEEKKAEDARKKAERLKEKARLLEESVA